MTHSLALEYGLDAEEYRDLCNRLERVPNDGRTRNHCRIMVRALLL